MLARVNTCTRAICLSLRAPILLRVTHMVALLSTMIVKITSAMNSMPRIPGREEVEGLSFSTESTVTQYLLLSTRQKLGLCSTSHFSHLRSNFHIWGGFRKTRRRKFASCSSGTFVSTITKAGTVVSLVLTILIIDGAVIFVRKRNYNKNARVMTPAGTDALAAGGLPYPPPSVVTLSHLQQSLRQARHLFLYRRHRCPW